MQHPSQYTVRAVHCDHRAGDEEIYRALARATAPLDRSWARLKAARRIVVKFNQAWPPDRLVYHAGHLQELVSEPVARATLRLLRENTTAELVCAEISLFAAERGLDPAATLPLLPLLREFGVSFLDGDRPPQRVYPVPGGGRMFRQYVLPEGIMQGDALVSVQKMKNHRFAGVTLCLKNLFGLVPQKEPGGRCRQYFHHVIRLPYVLADLGQLLQPALNIVDGLVAQAGAEWGGEARLGDALVAGDHVIATDACATHLMGHDPAADWPTPPFLADRNALRVAAEAGFGTVNLAAIDWASEVAPPLAEFHVRAVEPAERVARWRRSTCEQALYYRDHRRQFVDRYASEYILLQDGEVRWHNASSVLGWSRRELAGLRKDSALWLKLVDPDEAEGEHYEVYERTLAALEEHGQAPA